MSEQIITTARLRKGKLQVRDWTRVASVLAHKKDGEYYVVIERAYATRSPQANRFYWGVVVQALSEHTGYSPDEMHAILKAKFIPKRCAVTDGNGEIVDELVIGGSSAQLTIGQFQEYCGEIQRWAAESLGVIIPDPAHSEAA